MVDTIKAKIGYKVKVLKSNWGLRGLFDGEELLLVGQLRSMSEYVHECEYRENECAVKYDIFSTVSGSQYIYWGDYETGEDFLTLVPIY